MFLNSSAMDALDLSPSSSSQQSSNQFKNRIRGIKELVDSGIQHVPANYIRPTHERPCLSPAPHKECIPVISLLNLVGEGRAQVVEQIGRACEEWGFFQVVDHGFPQAVRDRMWKAAYDFFDMPAEERMRLYTEDLRSLLVYRTSFNPGKETVLEWKDTLILRRIPDIEFDGFEQAPEFFRRPAMEFMDQMKALASDLWDAMLDSLGLDTNSLDRGLSTLSDEVLSATYYPPCPDPSLTFGLSRHSDPDMFTILMPDLVPGLQILKGDKWLTVEPVPDSFVVNVGDLIQILTNGKYKSVEHRVVTNSEKPRMSIPCFFAPDRRARVASLAKFVDDQNPALYKEIVYDDYLRNFSSKALNGKSNLDFAKAAISM